MDINAMTIRGGRVVSLVGFMEKVSPTLGLGDGLPGTRAGGQPGTL